MSTSPLINIQGDVWLLADIVSISLDEPEDGEDWMISIKLRGSENWHIYDMDSEGHAQNTHLELVRAWERWLTS